MPAIIGALIAALFQALRQYLPGILGRVLLAFGIGFVTHTVAMPALISFVQSKVGSLPAVLAAYFGALGFDVAVTMILSAWIAARSQSVILSKLGSS
jgi:hypothetical protein